MLPEDGFGTGLSQLPTKAPKTFEYVNKQIEKLSSKKLTEKKSSKSK